MIGCRFCDVTKQQQPHWNDLAFLDFLKWQLVSHTFARILWIFKGLQIYLSIFIYLFIYLFALDLSEKLQNKYEGTFISGYTIITFRIRGSTLQHLQHRIHNIFMTTDHFS